MPRRPIWPWVLAACIPLLGWWSYGLFDLDEGFYAAVVAEMNRRGEWITPFYNGHPWFEKPILLYWLAKPCVMLFGNAVGPRLPSVLATVALLGLVAWFARRRLSPGAGALAPLVLGSCLLVVAIGRMMLTDGPLDLCLAGAFFTFWESLEGDPRWRLATAACLGFGVLAKGPVTLALFAAVGAIVYWRQPEIRYRFRGWWALGTVVLVAVVALWYVPAYLQSGHEFVQKFLIEQNVGRFTGGDQAHTIRGLAGLIFYIPVLLVGMLPWSLYLPKAWPWRPSDRAPLPFYLATWALVPFCFFTLSGAKLPHYVLPSCVPAALLVADYLARRRPNDSNARRALGPLAAIVVVGAVAQGGFAAYYYGATLGGLELPGFHAEVHGLARDLGHLAGPGDAVAVYQMSRQDRELGTGKPKIQETSHPSLLFYLNRDVVDTDDFGQILRTPGRVWILTRWNRIGPGQMTQAASAGRALMLVESSRPDGLYRLYRLDAR